MITIGAVVLLHLGVIAVLVGVNGCRTTSGFEKPGDLSAYTGVPGAGASAPAAAPRPPASTSPRPPPPLARPRSATAAPTPSSAATASGWSPAARA